jgi:hypothetical protein
MRNLLFLFLCAVSFSLYAQKGAKPERYAKTITAADLKKQLYIIAAPEMEGRETATEGQRKAAAYIESEFRRIGLQPGANGSFQQPFPVYQDSLVDAKLEVNGQAFNQDADFNANVNSPVATLRFSEVLFVPAGVPDDSLLTMPFAGRLVMMQAAAGNRYALLQNSGAAGILLISGAYPRSTPPLRIAQMLYGFKKTVPPQLFTISPAVARTILNASPDSLQQSSVVKVYKSNVLLEVRKQTTELKSTNVVGVLPGTDLKDEYLVITAHYDHIGKRDTVINYGADDDGSGTASVIELAEAFVKAKAAGKGPRRSIVFMPVSGEEKGLWGSEYYGDHPLFPLDKTTANLNIDMIGRTDPKRNKGDSLNYVYVVGDDKLSSDLRVISEAANNRYTKLELDYKYNDPDDKEFIYYRSDHYNFAKNGVPIIFYFNGTHADYHRPTDTPDKINYPLLAKRAQLVFYTAWEMANRPAMLKRDLPLPLLLR